MADEAKRMFTLHDVVAGDTKEHEIRLMKGFSGSYEAKDEKGDGGHFQLILLAAL
jgi:hypothetical protein